MARIITTKLTPPPKITTPTPKHVVPSKPIVIPLPPHRQQKSSARNASDFDLIRTQLQKISLKEEELGNRIDILSQKMSLLETAIVENVVNDSQKEANRFLAQVEEQIIRLKFAIKDLDEAIKLIDKQRGVDPSDASKIKALSSKLDRITQSITNLDNLLVTLKSKIRDREAYNGSVARYNRNPETLPFGASSLESYIQDISGIKEALVTNGKDVSILLCKINSIIASVHEIITPPDHEFQFDLEL